MNFIRCSAYLLLFYSIFFSSLIAKETQTPIKHLVVLFPENSSFDHLFGTYPKALNPKGEPCFKAKPKTPAANVLSKGLLRHNTNLANPFRLDRSEVNRGNPAHHYKQLQIAYHAGLLDHFVQVNHGDISVMGYFDGNTVTALWNYAQHFSMNDNCFATTFGPSTCGAINLISGQTHGAIPAFLENEEETLIFDGTILNDLDPKFDKCSKGQTAELTGRNIGNLLNEKNITWGWFQGGFRDCEAEHHGFKDYVPHHEPFQFYASTANPQHLPPSSIQMIGHQDRANHQYDLIDFWAAADHHHLPSVSFLKPRAFQNGHPVNSHHLELQRILVRTINRLQRLPEWSEMAIIIIWDDGGGWYDHVMPPIINQSHIPPDALISPGNAGDVRPKFQGQLAYGPRLPCLIISPFAKVNYIDHTLIDQTSVIRFIEDNWCLGRIGGGSFDKFAGSILNMFDFKHPKAKPLFLDPMTGEPLRSCEHSSDKD